MIRKPTYPATNYKGENLSGVCGVVRSC